MAKIPQYISQMGASTQPGATMPRMPGNGSELIGQAFSNLGSTLGNMANNEKRLELEAQVKADRIQADRDKQWAINATTRYQTRLAERQFEEEQNMPPGGLYEDGTTYVDRSKKIFKDEADAIDLEAPNEEASNMFKANAFQISEKEYVSSLGTQAKEAARYAIDQSVNGSQEDVNLLVKRPDLLPEVWARRKEAIDSATNIGARTKQAILEKIGPSYAVLQLQKDLNDVKMRIADPMKIVGDIDSGKYEAQMKALGLTIPPNELQAYRDKALAMVKPLDTENKYLLTKDAENLVTDASLTGKKPADEVYAKFEPNGKSYIAALKDKVELAADTASMNRKILLDPAGFAKEALPKLAPKAGTDSTRQVAIYEAAVTQLQAQQKLLQTDPGAAANDWFRMVSNSTDPGVEKAMLTAIARSAEDPNAGPISLTLNTDPTSGQLDTYSATALKVAYLRTQGLSDKQISILSKEEAKSMVDAMQKPDPLGMQGEYDTVRQGLTQLKAAYGSEYFPKVLNELTKAGLPQAYSALLWADGSVYSNKMVAALQTNVAVYEKATGLPTAELSALKDTIARETSVYTNPVKLGAPTGERTSFVNGINDLIYKVVIQQKSVAPDTDLTKYTKDIVNDVIHNRFHVTDTQTIPKQLQGIKTDPDLIVDRLEGVQRNLKTSDIAQNFLSNLPKEVVKTNLLETIKSSGYWVTNSSSTGAYLAIDVGGYVAQPVIGITGNRIERGYKDISSPLYRGPAGRTRVKDTIQFPGKQDKKTNNPLDVFGL